MVFVNKKLVKFANTTVVILVPNDIMFLDYEIYFDRPDRAYSPGDTVTCKIDVKSMFSLNCKYVRARFRCPFKSKDVEYFRIYEIASKRIATRSKDQWKYRNGEKGLSVGLRVMF